MLKKLALVSAISMISAGSFAMEAMDEETMSATTGQDGITINIVPDAISYTSANAMGVTDDTMKLISTVSGGPAPLYKGLSIGEIRVHDDDGLGTLGTDDTANSGALVIGGGADGATAAQIKADRTVILAKGDKPIQINLDMVGDSNGSAANGGAMLNVEIKQPALAIKLGNIYVANSDAAEAGFDADGNTNPGGVEVDGATVSGKVKILDGLEIVMGESTMTIQLGNESQGSMIIANATLVGGLTLNNFALYDQAGSAALTADNLLTGTVGSGGSFRASSIKITDNGGNDLTANTSIDFGSRVSSPTTVTTAGKDTFIYNKTSGAIPTVAAAVGHVNNLTTLRDAEAEVQFGVGSTYAGLTTTQQGAVDGVVSVANTAAYTAGLQGAGLIAAANYAGTFANGAADGVNTLTETNTWGGVDTYNGLVITSELGGATGADITIANAVVGDLNASVMGDVQILGLMLGKSKIVIMGH